MSKWLKKQPYCKTHGDIGALDERGENLDDESRNLVEHAYRRGFVQGANAAKLMAREYPEVSLQTLVDECQDMRFDGERHDFFMTEATCRAIAHTQRAETSGAR